LEASTQNRNGYQQHLSIAVLALLYGNGLRRGELERLDLEHWKRGKDLRIDGRRPDRNEVCQWTEGIGAAWSLFPCVKTVGEARGVS